MAVALPDVVEIGIIELEPNIPFIYAAWGIRYQFSPEGGWRVVEMAFQRKIDAENWMHDRYQKLPDMVAEVIPVKRTVLLLDEKGTIKEWTEELTEE